MCYKCFIWMLRIFAVVQLFSCLFGNIFDAYFKCLICLLSYVVTVLHLYDSKIDWVTWVAHGKQDGDASGPARVMFRWHELHVDV
jgi:hypothetical protein